ncbi:putative phospholipase B-like 2 [Periplaneta americana]|uniref:putative phospholipase B-like 2 n=1 Tax=Periplaneta americana TaxID=6978 RepID=UPI0037E91CDF
MDRRNFVVTLFLVLLVYIQAQDVSGRRKKTLYLYENENGIHLTHRKLRDESWIIQGCFASNYNTTGWDILHMQRNPNFTSDTLSAYYVGVIEGSLTHDTMYQHWYNTLNGYCDNKAELCQKVQHHLDTNVKWMKEMIANHSNTDPYWYQVELFLRQLEGLVDGYMHAVTLKNDNSKNLTLNDLLWLNVQGDLDDVFEVYRSNQSEEYVPLSVRGEHLPGSSSCSALIKLLPDSSDLYVAHDTWSSLQSMLKMQKKYDLHYKILPNSSITIPGSSMTFSAYPGTIQSGDDFYITSAGLAIVETTIGNGNLSLWQNVKAEGQVMEQIRTMVTNRLADSGMKWSKLFSLYNSGTYNNQWMVVDYKLFKKGTSQSQLKDNLLWILEQLPGHIRAEDKTDVLRQQSYWPSYNTPYYPDIYNISGQRELAQKYGDWFTYDRTPRALIFKRDHVKVNDTSSMIALMRYNDYLHDPLSACNCTPPYSGENAIACRSDVNPINGTYPFEALGHRPHVATDAKLVTADRMISLQFIGVSGPPYNENLPKFRWSTSDFNHLPHLGHADVFEFQPSEWSWDLC